VHVRVLVATVDAGGNSPPTLAILRELVGRGHDVRALAHGTQQPDLELAGVAARPWTSPRPWDPRPAQPGARSLLAWLRLASDPGYAQDLRAAALLVRPDVVLVDCMIPGALRGARAAGAPVALLVHAFSDYWYEQWAGRGPMALWQRLRSCSPLRPAERPRPLRHRRRLAVPRDSSVDVIQVAARRVLEAAFGSRAAAVGQRLRRTDAAREGG
jgi:UDP:flavonoid glycosyltransferase YjiC (YdhE family)